MDSINPLLSQGLLACLAVSLIIDFVGPSLYAKAIGLLSIFSEFSCQPNYRFYRSGTLVKAVGLFELLVYLEVI